MRTNTIFIILSILLLSISKGESQDVIFSQWENAPAYTNPALTGDFEGVLRFRAKYRNQFSSILKSNSYKTGVASVEYKFGNEKLRKFNIGFHSLLDRAGESKFTTSAYNISTSVIHNLGDFENAHHVLAIGFNFGLARRSVELQNLVWQSGSSTEGKLKTGYGDISLGLNWKYISNSNFSIQLGSALNHINRPNVSFFDTGEEKLNLRFNLHGGIEVPVVNKISLIPSFIFHRQGPFDLLMFGLYSKWYLNSTFSNNLQFGILTRAIDGNSPNIYTLSAVLELNSFLFGFSFDRFSFLKSNAFEFSVGYAIGRKNEN